MSWRFLLQATAALGTPLAACCNGALMAFFMTLWTPLRPLLKTNLAQMSAFGVYEGVLVGWLPATGWSWR